MKTRILSNIFLAALAIAAAMSVLLNISTSCNKKPQDPLAGFPELPSAPFTLTAVEERDGAPMTFPWTVSKSGVTDSVNESIDEMYVTRVNHLTFTVEPSGASFQGVNVRSSDESRVKVVAIDAKHFALEYVEFCKDGVVTVEVWNGSGAAQQMTAFKVNVTDYILPTAVVFVYDEGTEREKEIYAKEWFFNQEELFISYYDSFIDKRRKNLDDRRLKKEDFHITINAKEEFQLGYPPKILHSLRFDRVEPENTSYRKVSFDAKRYKEFVMQEFIDYLESENLSTEWIKPYNGDMSEMNRIGYFAVCGGFFAYNLSLCELSLSCASPKGSKGLMQTAVLLYPF